MSGETGTTAVTAGSSPTLSYFDAPEAPPPLLKPVLWVLALSYGLSALGRGIDWFQEWMFPPTLQSTGTRIMADRWYSAIDVVMDVAGPYFGVAIPLLSVLAFRRVRIVRVTLMALLALSIAMDFAWMLMLIDPTYPLYPMTRGEMVTNALSKLTGVLSGAILPGAAIYVLLRRDVRDYYYRANRF